jgi:phosphatidylserine decarboxylase
VFAPRAGRFLGPAAGLAVLFAALLWSGLLPEAVWGLGLFAVALALTVFFAVFFRDPERAPGEGIVAAADGRVRAVETEGATLRVSVFMNVTNVHVNRLPIDARVESVSSSGSGHLPAYRADAAHNVQRRYELATAIGPVAVVQITGVLARRLVSFVKTGSVGRKGDRFGMVVLGSRVDVLLPADRVVPTVRVGDAVRAGTSTIARERP